MGEVIAGFDTALWRTGWAVVCHDGRDFAQVAGGGIGSARSLARGAKAQALGVLYAQTETILREHKPDVVVLEKPGKWARASWKSSQASVEAMAMARGVVMAAAWICGVPCEELDVGVARERVLGRSGADKEAVRYAIRALGFPILEREDGTPDLDYCDAALLAVASRWDSGRLSRTLAHGT